MIADGVAGHSSYVTHVDWSADGSMLQSNCGGYEHLFWDGTTGKMLKDSPESAQWVPWT